MSGATVVDLTHLRDESTDWSTSDSESPNDEPQLIHSNQPSQPSQPNEHINDRDSEVTNEPSTNRDDERTAHLIPCSPSNMGRPAKKKVAQRPPLNLSGLSKSSPVPSGSAPSSESNEKKAPAPKSANVTKNTGASKPNNSTKGASVSQPANAKKNPSVVSSAKNTKQTNQPQLSDPDQMPEAAATEDVEASDRIAMRTKIQQLIEALKNVSGIQNAITDESELDDQENENDTTEHQQASDDHTNRDIRFLRAISTDLSTILAARRMIGQGRPSTTPLIEHHVPILNRPKKRPREESVTSTVSNPFHKSVRLFGGEISVNTPSEISESPGRPQSTNPSALNKRPQTNRQTLHFDKEGSNKAVKAEDEDIYDDDEIAPQSRSTTTIKPFKGIGLRLFDEDSEDSDEEKSLASAEKTDTDRKPRPLTDAEQVEAKSRIVSALQGRSFRQRTEVLLESLIGLLMELGVDPSGRIEERAADLFNN